MLKYSAIKIDGLPNVCFSSQNNFTFLYEDGNKYISLINFSFINLTLHPVSYATTPITWAMDQDLHMVNEYVTNHTLTQNWNDFAVPGFHYCRKSIING